jgi:hypothetical protein
MEGCERDIGRRNRCGLLFNESRQSFWFQNPDVAARRALIDKPTRKYNDTAHSKPLAGGLFEQALELPSCAGDLFDWIAIGNSAGDP